MSRLPVPYRLNHPAWALLGATLLFALPGVSWAWQPPTPEEPATTTGPCARRAR